MKEFFEVLTDLKMPAEKKYFITIEGRQHEVSLEKKLWATRIGEENLIFKDNEIQLKPKPKPATVYPELVESEKGYIFLQDDIHWPMDIKDGGVTWQIKYE